MENVPLGESEFLLQIPRRENLLEEDRALESGAILLQRVDDRVTERVALLGPPRRALFDVIWRVLDEDRHDVLPGRRHARIR